MLFSISGMPNTTGGKNYKKSKHSSGASKPAFIDRQADQMYARVIKNLGDRNMLTYCNDGKVRLCHIRGSMRKRCWIQVGDLVLISLRDFEKSTSESGRNYERGDIVAKYDEDHLGHLKKQTDINKKLFMQLETMDGQVLAELGRREANQNTLHMPDEESFEFEREDKVVQSRKRADSEEGSASGSDSDKDSDAFDIDKI